MVSNGRDREDESSSFPSSDPRVPRRGTEDRPPILSYREFWSHYVGLHQRPLTRRLHFAGTTGAILCVLAAVLYRELWLLLGAPVIAYGLAWIGHFVVEKNGPATFRYPLRSLAADFHMFGLMSAGRMNDEVGRLTMPNEMSQESDTQAQQ